MHRLYEGYSGKHYRVVVNTLLSSYAHPSEVSSMSAARAFCREGYWMSVFHRDAQHPSSTLVHHILPAYRYIAQDSARCTGEHKAAGQFEWFSNDLDVQVWYTCCIHCFCVESGFKLGRCNDVLLLCMERP
jgi:hypothetical protein